MRKRKRALRAAYAVTIGVTLAASGCGETHEPADAMPDVMTADAGCAPGFPETEECCEEWGGEWIASGDGTGGCSVPGPFVPPRMV